MLASLIKKIFRDKRAATAVALAIMTIPLLIAAGAAVDFARIASARTLLQAAVDSAASAAGGAWQMSESSTQANQIATFVFNSTGAQLPNFVTVQPDADGNKPTVTLACTGTPAATGSTPSQCGGTAPFSTTLFANCTKGVEYCVQVTATVTLNNSILGFLIPSEVLTASAYDSVGYGYSQNSVPIPAGAGFNSAGDYNVGAAYAVPMDGPGGTPDYNKMPNANSKCSSTPQLSTFAKNGVYAPAAGVTACNYLFIADSAGNTGTGGTLALSQNQPIAFAYSNKTGGNGYTSSNYTTSTTNLMISTGSSSSGFIYYPNGSAVLGPGTPAVTCTAAQTNCTPQPEGPPTSTPLLAKCPDHTLYGSLDSNNDGAPLSDSLNIYSSAYEMLGEPPTYETNHVLTPFVSTLVNTQTINGQTYYVRAVCPNYPTTGTQISAPVSAAYGSFAGANAFSSWFPGKPFTDSAAAPATDSSGNAITTGIGDIFPPTVGGCTPATNSSDGGVTPASDDPWWGWSPSNINPGNCTTPQSANYTNCALIIEPLGTSAPTDSNGVVLMPDYYNTIETPTGTVLALDPVYDGMTYVDPVPGVTVVNNDPAFISGVQDGYTPTNTTPASVTITNATTTHGSTTPLYANTKYVGDILVTQIPDKNGNKPGLDHNPPLGTSHQCYNPSVATQNHGYIPPGSSTVAKGYTASGRAVDAIQNPQLGAVVCNSNPPQAYALYWNDLGTYEADDLGYWNDSYPFECSVPPITNAGGGSSLLSG